MKFTKKFAVVAMCAALALSLFGLVGCADNSKQVITDTLNEEIEELRNPDDATIEELAAELPTSTFKQLGLDTKEVVKALFEGFDGTVDDVVVEGKKAVATVSISCKDFSQLEDAIETIFDLDALDTSQFEGMSQSEIMEWAGQQVMTTINELPVITHDPIDIDYTLEGNTWTPAAGSENKLASEIFG